MIRALRLAAPLVLALAAAPAAATDINAMSADERAAFRAEVRAYLLDNPEVLMEAIAVLEDRQAAEQASGDAALIAAHAEQLFADPGSWIGGNLDGDVTVVEFLDYNCGYCKRAHPEVAALLEGDGNIRLVMKEFPILGEESVRGARYALAVRSVAGDDTYKEISDALMSMRSDITNAALERLSEAYVLDHAAILLTMFSPEVDAIIANNRALASILQINGTPSFVFGDQMVRGYVQLDTMQALVAQARGG